MRSMRQSSDAKNRSGLELLEDFWRRNMKPYSEAMYWRTNKEWYVADYEHNKFKLTKAAPQRAVRSFRMYKRQNRWVRIKDLYEKIVGLFR